MGLGAIRRGLKANIEPRMPEFTVLDYEDKTPPPWSIVISWPDTYDPRATIDGTPGVDVIIPVRILIPWQDDDSSDEALEDAFDAARSAIEADRTLGGACDDLSCGPFTAIGARTMNDDSVVLTFTVPVEILA